MRILHNWKHFLVQLNQEGYDGLNMLTRWGEQDKHTEFFCGRLNGNEYRKRLPHTFKIVQFSEFRTWDA
jgi:hypothetical protein